MYKMEEYSTSESVSLDHNYYKGSSKLSCSKCDRKLKNQQELTEHLHLHSAGGQEAEKIKCNDCEREYVNFTTFTHHINAGKCRAVEEIESCKKCGKTFKKSDKFDRHVKYSKSCGSSQWSAECQKCHKTFNHKAAFTHHQRNPKHCHVAGEKPINEMCEFCGKVGFWSHYKFKEHVRSHIEDVVCKKCGLKFSDFAILRRHELQICMGDKTCDVCGEKGFSNIKKFSRHMLKHDGSFEFDTSSLDYKCGKCDLGFSRVSNRNYHVKHSCANGLICEYCGESDFKMKKEFRKHINDHGGSYIEPDLTGLICNLCFKSFDSVIGKDKHISSVHKGIKNPETGKFDFFPCDQCNEVMTTMEQLLIHQKIIHPIVPTLPTVIIQSDNPNIPDKIQCETCNKIVARKHIATHRRTHTGETPFECHKCGKRFKSGANLNYHRKKQTCSETGQETGSCSK